MNHGDLRPLERTVLKRTEEGMPVAEIAWRLRRKPGTIQRIIDHTELDRSAATDQPAAEGALRPLERYILGARQSGTNTAEIAARLRRTPDFVTRVERYANHKLAVGSGD